MRREVKTENMRKDSKLSKDSERVKSYPIIRYLLKNNLQTHMFV